MKRADLDIEERKPFGTTQKNSMLLRQSICGADRVYRAQCDVCSETIAELNADGRWVKQRPFEFDHVKARGLGGRTTEANGRAICGHPFACHKTKSADDVERMAKADAQGGRTGQWARRAALKANGGKPRLQGRGFQNG